MGVYNDRIHVRYQLFKELINEQGNLEVVKRNCSEYPFEATFTKNGLTYLSLHTEEEIKNIFEVISMNALQQNELLEVDQLQDAEQQFEITDINGLNWAFRKLAALKAKEKKLRH